MKKLSTNIFFLFLIVCLIVLGTLLYVYFSSSGPSRALDKATECNDEWYYLTTDGKAVYLPTLPTKITIGKNSYFSIYHTIPPHESASTLWLKSGYQELTVTLEPSHQVLHTAGSSTPLPFGKETGIVQHYISIPPSSSVQTLTLTFSTPYLGDSISLTGMLYGAKDAIVFWQLQESVGILVLCGILFLLFIIFIIIYLALRIVKAPFHDPGLLYLGFFTLLSALWILTDTTTAQLFLGNLPTQFLLSLCSFMLLPIPFFLYVKRLVRHGQTMLRLISLILLANLLVQLVLYATGLVPFIYMLPVTHLLLVFAGIVILVLCIREQFVYKNKEFQLVNLALAVFTVLSVCALVAFYVKAGGYYAHIFLWGIFLFIALLCLQLAHHTISLIRQTTEVETYRRMAYKDVMTRLSNRAAFDLALSQLEMESASLDSLAFIVFDLNNLKHINDIFGHAVGDQVIQNAAAIIKLAFDDMATCFRIGGDEFVAIVRNRNQHDIESRLQILVESLKKQDRSRQDFVDLAFGYAISSSSSLHQHVQELFSQADANMYQFKKTHRKINRP